ncbi:Acyl-CoA reductase [Sphingobium sp. AP50]|uniref:aldehyde dehydrogenase family protein n=1 Tax=Sphingobium sp. AP50 TaxID=1884369 RepID=UPI0008C7A72A|nr:aldehyde dehydrogenase family protein [Sphingobium sp. AP50]SEJ99041.1 Acyl-CoA reductase [Sphingobium sp. AP50]
MTEYKLLIGGNLVDGAETMPVINPATGEIFTHCPRANAEQLEMAIEAARAAFPDWAARTFDERSALIIALADALESDANGFARLLTQEQGKPLDHAFGEVMGAVYILRGFAAMRLDPRILQDGDGRRIIETRSPLGVVAAITPWNYPVILLMHKVGPALLAGNTVIAKPAPTTPLTTLRFARICQNLLPAGVVNVITDQNDLGHLLTQHRAVAKIAFTGSTATGKKVMSAAAATLKRVTLELGGNDAAIILDDVDPVAVARFVFEGAMVNSGQVCVAVKRAYVPRDLYDVFCQELVRLAGEQVVDDGLSQGVTLGPLQNRAQYERVRELIDDARSSGNIIAGGRHDLRPGYFIEPTIIRDVPEEARIVQEEQFGPVLPVLAYDSLDVVIAAINNSEFGLAGTVWSRDIERAEAVADRIDSGTVWINQHMAFDVRVPFRGSKQSGFGGELGQEGLEEYTQPKIISSVPLAPSPATQEVKI